VRCDAKSRGIYAREIAGYRRFSDRNVIESDAVSRRRLLKVTWNTIEGIVAVLAGAVAGSISLVGFGIDSFIEVISGAALLWLMIVDADAHRRECNERRALRIVGFCFVALAAYVAYESANDLWQRQAAERSVPGIILACLSLVVMPLLSRAKRRVGLALGSAAMHADAKQAEFCTYLSAILLGGLVVSALFGLWWADPLAALIMVPIIAKEGIEAIQGKSCADCH
jgi:divalent metal cation (Fe/Co/Zn/Cd) transporter